MTKSTGKTIEFCSTCVGNSADGHEEDCAGTFEPTQATKVNPYGRAQIDPSEWTALGCFYWGNSDTMASEYRWDWIELAQNLLGKDDMDEDEFLSLVTFHENGGCASCGSHFAHGVVYSDGKTHIAVGHECASNYFRYDDKLAMTKARHQREAAKAAHRAKMRIKGEEFADAHNLHEILAYDHHITKDIERKLYEYGSISPKQIELLYKLKADDEARRKRAEEWSALQAESPTLEAGRYEVVGEVISTKWQDSFYGDVFKMLVQLDGTVNRVWGTVPKSLYADVEPGDVVRFTAQVEPKQDDEHFGFFKRPTKAEFVSKGEVE